MVRLFCAIVGDGRIFPVEIDLEETVAVLKEMINPDLTPFNAALLTLYLAKRGDTWVNPSHDDIRAVRNGDIPNTIKSLLLRGPMLEVTALDADAYFGKGFTPHTSDIHVLVQLPSTNKRSILEVDDVVPRPFPASRARTATKSNQPVDDAREWVKRFHASSISSTMLPKRTALGARIRLPLPVKIG